MVSGAAPIVVATVGEPADERYPPPADLGLRKARWRRDLRDTRRIERNAVIFDFQRQRVAIGEKVHLDRIGLFGSFPVVHHIAHCLVQTEIEPERDIAWQSKAVSDIG